MTAWAPLVMVIGLACGGDEAADGESAEVEAEAPPEPEADEAPEQEEAEEKAPVVLLQHPEGPLRTRKHLFFGLMKSGRSMPFQDGRVLTGYRLRTEREYKVGEAAMTSAEWYFSRDRKLRVHRLWADGMESSACDLAAAKIVEGFGEPLESKRGVKRWEKYPYELVWTDTSRLGGDQAVTRCELAYRDLAWLRGVPDEESVPE